MFLHAAANPIIVNTIVSGTIYGGAVYITSSPNASLSYCDFHNNSGGNFPGVSRPGLGILSTVNANGDSCDSFMNIYLNPRFVNPAAGDYHLQANSHCIDAGDPASPLDPDSTIADIGAFYFDQSGGTQLVVTFTPHNPPIRIPANGGSFTFDASVANTTLQPVTFDAWTEVVLPNGGIYGPLFLRTNLRIPPSATITRVLRQSVPGYAPSGNYTFVGNAGTHPATVIDSDEFPFTKLSTDDGTIVHYGWECWGWDGWSEPDDSALPSEYGSLMVCPNPFNPTTKLTFTLPAPQDISLTVYDIRGRQVSCIIDGWYEAGEYSVMFDGNGLPSGVYFAELKTQEDLETLKILLVK